MGSGIAQVSNYCRNASDCTLISRLLFLPQVAATSGYNVTLVDLNEDVLKTAQASITKNLTRVAKKQFKDNECEQANFVQTALKRLNTSVDVNCTVQHTDLVIEAIVENMSVKHKLFSAIDKVGTYFIDHYYII